MKAWKYITRSLADYTFEYSTPKIVTVRSVKIGLLCRFVELGIVAYVIGPALLRKRAGTSAGDFLKDNRAQNEGKAQEALTRYAIIYCKGYQESDIAQTGVTVKVKGVASTMHRKDLPQEYRRVWDAADYVIPPLQNNAFFILTNVIVTPRQRQAICAEDPNASPGAICDPADNHCQADAPVKYGNGLMTGLCVPSDRNDKPTDTCEIYSWCPTENDKPVSPKAPLLTEAENFTAFIKNSVEFQRFRVRRRNTDTITDPKYLSRCLYDPDAHPHCPIFEIGKMIKLAGGEFNRLGVKGGVVNILIKWDCDLDYATEYCVPRFTFSLLDDINTKIAPGWNFRYANYYRDANGTLYRDLVKASGILFLFNVQGKAGKFSIIQFSFNIGAGLALLGIAQVLCDWIILYVVKERHIYKQVKFLNIDQAQPLADGKVQIEEGLLPKLNTSETLVTLKTAAGNEYHHHHHPSSGEKTGIYNAKDGASGGV